MSLPVVAVIVAAGLGLRYGGPTPKPVLKLTGRALIAMSIEAMSAGGCTDAIVVINPRAANHFNAALTGAPIPVRLTPGGDTRQESVHAGLKVVAADPRLATARAVLVHDAVRPMVPADVVERVILGVDEGYPAVAPAVLVTDSIRLLGSDGTTSPVDRTRLRSIQTPQGFPLDVILSSHERLAASGLEFTDDVTCAEHTGHPVTLVEGSRLAMKITEPMDLTVARALWKVRDTFGHHSGRRVMRLWSR